MVEKAVKKSDEERRQSCLVQWVKDLFGRMLNKQILKKKRNVPARALFY